jgi:hypothetical protein
VDKLFVAIVAAASLISIAVVAAFAFEVLQSSSSLPPSSSSSPLLLSPPAMQNDNKEQVGFFTGTNNNDDSSLVVDPKGDAWPDKQYETSIVPAVKGYHDILWAEVRKITGGTFLLTIGLDGNPNLNEKYETAYVWHIITSSNHVYTVILPNFAPDSSFAAKGWYFAVYNNTGQKYAVPMTRMSFDMPKDRVEFPLEESLVGSPQSFHYWVSVHVRVDSQNLDKPPDYLMDYAP